MQSNYNKARAVTKINIAISTAASEDLKFRVLNTEQQCFMDFNSIAFVLQCLFTLTQDFKIGSFDIKESLGDKSDVNFDTAYIELNYANERLGCIDLIDHRLAFKKCLVKNEGEFFIPLFELADGTIAYIDVSSNILGDINLCICPSKSFSGEWISSFSEKLSQHLDSVTPALQMFAGTLAAWKHAK